MKLKLTSSGQEYGRALMQWLAQFRMSVRAGLRLQGRLLGERLIAFTPPQSAGQGRRRVEKDIRKVVLGLNDMRQFGDMADAVGGKIVETVGGEVAVRIFAKKDGTVYGVDRNLYRPDATFVDIWRHHQQYRDSRGRVTEAGQKTRDIGRWRFLDVLVVPAGQLDEYIAAAKDRVGRAKGGWASGVVALGGTVQDWIQIHARTAGAFYDHTTDAEPYMEFENNSEWASGGDKDRIVANAVNTRIRDMRAMVKKAMRDADFANRFVTSHSS